MILVKLNVGILYNLCVYANNSELFEKYQLYNLRFINHVVNSAFDK